jgi:diguanylate cyclase (GGDEF)-like protein
MGIGVVVVDVTERKELEVQLRDQSLHDGLTGLANRTLLLDRAKALMEMAQSDQIPVSVLFMDVDNFKTVNDGLGHHAGDELLIAVSKRLTGAMRSEETVCRFGDDEFVILANSRVTMAPPELIAARVTDVMRSPFELDGHVISVTMSIGIASGFDMGAEKLVRNAHIAMYQAKLAGKNATVTFTPPMHESAFDRLHLEIDLRAAVERNEFAVLYQPTIALNGGVLAGVEALVRWDHPTRGRLVPSQFLDLAEDTGLMLDIGNLVLVDACATVSRWQRGGIGLSLAVNISASQLESAHLVRNIRSVLEETGIAPESVILEVTETTVMRDVEVVIERLKMLKGLGVRLAIDDFGTGYSSLSYLRQFPVDILKIDQSFVAGIQDSAEQRAIVHALIELGKALDLEIIAEGVESEAQLRFLGDEGCDSVQGYFFAPALDDRALERFAAEWIL